MNWVEIPVVNQSTMPAGKTTAIAAVQLPEPDSNGNWEPLAGPSGWLVHTGCGVGIVYAEADDAGEVHAFTPSQARNLAAALLAAANTVDGDR